MSKAKAQQSNTRPKNSSVTGKKPPRGKAKFSHDNFAMANTGQRKGS